MNVQPIEMAIKLARPMVSDQAQSTLARTQALWAAAKAVRDTAKTDVFHLAFFNLAIEAVLITKSGWWAGEDVRASVRRHGAEDIHHVISWASRGLNPFGEPLQ